MKSTPTTQEAIDAEWDGLGLDDQTCDERSEQAGVGSFLDSIRFFVDFTCDRPKGHSGQHAHGDMNGLVVVWGRP